MAAPLPTTTDALVGVYRKPPVEFVRGAGVELFDSDGKAYLDFVAGIAVNALGYGDAGLEQAMRKALDGSLIHLSNLYRTQAGERLAEQLVKKVLPIACSSVIPVLRRTKERSRWPVGGAVQSAVRRSMRSSRFVVDFTDGCLVHWLRPTGHSIAHHSVRSLVVFRLWSAISMSCELR